MITVGIDVGYSYTKDDKQHIFPSAYSLYSTALTGEKKITIDGTSYYVGKGKTTTDHDKIHTDLNKVCTLYAIAQDYDFRTQNDYCVAVGLPVSQYKESKAKLRETVLSYNKCNIIYNNQNIKMNIASVKVYPQGVASLFTLKEKLYGEYIVIDIGGGTVDVSLSEFDSGSSQIIKTITLYEGIKTLYNDIITAINNKFELKLSPEYAEKAIMFGTLLVNGKVQDLSFLTPILAAYVDRIIDIIKVNFQTEICKLILCGGGSITLFSPIQKRLPTIQLIENSQFSNAIGYSRVARFGGNQ